MPFDLYFEARLYCRQEWTKSDSDLSGSGSLTVALVLVCLNEYRRVYPMASSPYLHMHQMQVEKNYVLVYRKTDRRG